MDGNERVYFCQRLFISLAFLLLLLQEKWVERKRDMLLDNLLLSYLVFLFTPYRLYNYQGTKVGRCLWKWFPSKVDKDSGGQPDICCPHSKVTLRWMNWLASSSEYWSKSSSKEVQSNESWIGKSFWQDSFSLRFSSWTRDQLLPSFPLFLLFCYHTPYYRSSWNRLLKKIYKKELLEVKVLLSQQREAQLQDIISCQMLLIYSRRYLKR